MTKLRRLIEAAQKNEVRYIDPDNLDRYDKDEIEAVKDASGDTRYRRKQGIQNKSNSYNKTSVKDKDKVKAYIDNVTKTDERGNYDETKVLDYSGDLRKAENWPDTVDSIQKQQYQIRAKLYDQYKDNLDSEEVEKYKQQYKDVYNDATEALKKVDAKDRFDRINKYYKNADYAYDELGVKTSIVRHIMQSFGYNPKTKKEMRAVYKELKTKL